MAPQPAQPTPARDPLTLSLSKGLRRAVNRALGRANPAPPKSTNPKAVEGPRPEDKSWQAGDIAECIHTGPWFCRSREGRKTLIDGPLSGQRFCVAAVGLGRLRNDCRTIILQFRELPGEWFEAVGFRKIQPVADKAEAADSTFLKDLHHRLARQPERV